MNERWFPHGLPTTPRPAWFPKELEDAARAAGPPIEPIRDLQNPCPAIGYQSCLCRLPAGHEGPHSCSCGDDWLGSGKVWAATELFEGRLMARFSAS